MEAGLFGSSNSNIDCRSSSHHPTPPYNPANQPRRQRRPTPTIVPFPPSSSDPLASALATAIARPWVQTQPTLTTRNHRLRQKEAVHHRIHQPNLTTALSPTA